MDKVLKELVQYVEQQRHNDYLVQIGEMTTRYKNLWRRTYMFVKDCNDDEPLCSKCFHYHGFSSSMCVCSDEYCANCRSWNPFGGLGDLCTCEQWCQLCRDHHRQYSDCKFN